MPRESSAFDRLFPIRDLWATKARRGWFWGLFAAILVFLTALAFLLLVELGVSGGNLNVPPEKQAEVTSLLDLEDYPRPSEAGILPATWHTRNTAFNALIIALYGIEWLQNNDTALWCLLGSLLLLCFLQAWVIGRHHRLAEGVASDVANRLRRNLHRQALRLGPSDLTGDDEHTPVRELFTKDVGTVEAGVAARVYRLTFWPAQIIVVLAFAVLLDWKMALQCLLPLVACFFLLQRAGQRAAGKQAVAEDRAKNELARLTERLHRTRLIRGFRMEQYEHENYGQHLDIYRGELAAIARETGRSLMLSRLLVIVFLLLVSFLVFKKTIERPSEFAPAVMVSLLASFVLLWPAMHDLWGLRGMYSAANVAADRIQRYLETTPDVSQAVGARFLQPLSKAIQFESVVFRAPRTKRPLLNGLDLKIPAGQVTALISIDPMEARALAALLPRFIEPTSGRVLFDGEDTAWATLESLRAETVFVDPAEPFFTGTVFDNLACGDKKQTFSAVTEAAKRVHAHSFIQRLKQGYETVLGEHGEQLDPSERFRLCLARAVLRDPALLVIEEPNEPFAEDAKSLVDDAYQRVFPGRTVIVIPSRLTTIKRAAHIAVLHQGRLHAMAAHGALVQKSPLYRHWEYVRFNEFRHITDPA